MRRLALLLFTLSCAPTFLFAQGDAAAGEVIATVQSETGTPLAEAEVAIESHQALTDPHGIARLRVPAGRHRLTVARIGFEPARIEVEDTADCDLRVHPRERGEQCGARRAAG
ncbi:MAG: carboxypeptidase-like regulatory domain-containing protein [Gemmatimonadota bacterium]|nr:carboxypeptidase-like regulatory domain-containing protein [Gemmatimonadota bacterium]